MLRFWGVILNPYRYFLKEQWRRLGGAPVYRVLFRWLWRLGSTGLVTLKPEEREAQHLLAYSRNTRENRT